MAKKTIKILAIDDHPDNLVVLKALVNDSFPDAVFIAADSGEKGFELCQSEKPDVILLDIVMPGMDGYEVCTKIKSDLSLSHIPVIMVTANRADKESRVKALDAGADAFLPKPVDDSELKAQIRAMLRIKESEDQKKEEKRRLEDMVLDRTEALEQELADRKKAENKLIQSLDKITRNKQAILNLMEDLKTEMGERKVVEENIKKKNNELLFLNNLATDLAGMSVESDMSEFLLKRLKEFTGSEFLVFSEYESEKRLLITRHIEADQKLLSGLIKIAGDKILNSPSPLELNDKNFAEIIAEVVTEKKSLRDISFGAIPSFIDNAFRKVTGFDRYFGLSFVVAGKLYGTALLGFNKDQLFPSTELLKSFAHISAISLHRKKAEQKLIESESYYRTLVDISPDGIILTDLEGKVAYGSIKAHEILGVPPGENVVGSSILRWLSTDSQNSIMERFMEIMKGNVAPETREYNLIKFDGSAFWGEISSSPLSDKNGNPLSLIIVCRDISERKKAEIDLIKAKEKAEESDRLKTAFLHNISHEIRTPMNAIIGFSSMLSEPDLDRESQTSYIDIITNSSNQLLSIVTDIIEISNIEAGIIKLQTKPVNLNSVIKTIHNQFLTGAAQNNIDFTVSTGLDDNEANILTDGPKLTQVLSCLLSNAVKFTHSGQISIGYKLNLNHIEFYVKDSGIGISRDQFSRIFERFYQVESTISRQYEGTGLGLSISKAYVELLGGTIWLDSVPGKGSTFYFSIPCSGTNGPVENVQKDTKVNISHSIENKTILVAEDEENNYRLLVELLSGLNLKIIHAGNGKEAVDICDSDDFIDLVLMDIKMPVMDGLEATALLKKRRPSLPVIAQTAFAFESDRDKVFKAGCDDYLSKPIKKDLLIAMVKKYIYK